MRTLIAIGAASERNTMPAGFPASVLSGNAMQFFQTKGYLVMVHEFQRNTRIIPLDGRPHRNRTLQRTDAGA